MPPNSPKITLYLSPGACSLAPHVLLREINASFSIVSINARSGLPPDFAQLNPKMRVPVLVLESETDGENEVITEVPAIMTCIAQMAPERKLLGRSDIEVVRSYEWMNWLSGWVHGVCFGGLWRPQRFVDDEADFGKVRSKGRKNIEEAFEMIEGKLREGEWAVGGAVSVVDVYLFVFFRWGNEVGVDMQGRFPRWAGLMGRLGKRESVRRVLEEEGVEGYLEKPKI